MKTSPNIESLERTILALAKGESANVGVQSSTIRESGLLWSVDCRRGGVFHFGAGGTLAEAIATIEAVHAPVEPVPSIDEIEGIAA